MKGIVHVHTHYSDGFLNDNEIQELSEKYLVCITDHDTLASALVLRVPFPAMELTLADGSHITLFARDHEEYAELCRLTCDALTKKLSLEDIFHYRVTIGTGCSKSLLFEHVLQGDCKKLAEIPNQLVVELSPGLPEELGHFWRKKGFLTVWSCDYHGDKHDVELLANARNHPCVVSLSPLFVADQENFFASFVSYDVTPVPPTIPSDWFAYLYNTAETDQERQELEMAQNLGYLGMFALVARYIVELKQAGMIVNIRGSARSSKLISRIAGLSDPSSLGLLFSRFMNPYRPSPPDVDIEVSDRKKALTVLAKTLKSVAYFAPLSVYRRFTENTALLALARLHGITPPNVNAFKKHIQHLPLGEKMLQQAKKLAGRIESIQPAPAGIIISGQPLPMNINHRTCVFTKEALPHYPFILDILQVDYLASVRTYSPVVYRAKITKYETNATIPHLNTYRPGLTLFGIYCNRGSIEYEDILIVLAVIRPAAADVALSILTDRYGENPWFSFLYPGEKRTLSSQLVFQEDLMRAVAQKYGQSVATSVLEAVKGKAQPSQEVSRILKEFRVADGYLFPRAHAVSVADVAFPALLSLNQDVLLKTIENTKDELVRLHCALALARLGVSTPLATNIQRFIQRLSPPETGGVIVSVARGLNYDTYIVTPFGAIPLRVLQKEYSDKLCNPPGVVKFEVKGGRVTCRSIRVKTLWHE